MDYFEKLVGQVRVLLFIGMALVSVVVGLSLWVGLSLLPELPVLLIITGAVLLGMAASVLCVRILARIVMEPVHVLWKAILHVTPEQREMAPPNLDKIGIGKDLIKSLALQVYQIASSSAMAPAGAKQPTAQASSGTDAVLTNFPLPVFITNKDQLVVYANTAAAHYIGKQPNEITNNNIYSVLDLSFSEEETLDAWLATSRNDKVTASRFWERVRLTLSDQSRKQCDIAAYYNKNNPHGIETVITLFDKSKSYGQGDDAISFIALAVHELRTPLTMLRGYIEVFEEELSGKLTPELDGFMKKMQASAQQLTAFVSNILNVARVEEDQLFLQLHEENWSETLKGIVNDMALRAHVHGKKIEYNIAENLPTAAVDKVSMYEVVGNLIDNAVKYGGQSQRIVVRSYLRDDGFIETTVQDFGIGIDASILGNLFEKFYRNHRSRAQVGGTGLGLYLSKAIVKAHGGQIWVQSKEGQGSIFGFTLQQYSQLAETQKTTDNQDIRRVAHGWIKNHSFYKR